MYTKFLPDAANVSQINKQKKFSVNFLASCTRFMPQSAEINTGGGVFRGMD
jgi:hypothetical protein